MKKMIVIAFIQFLISTKVIAGEYLCPDLSDVAEDDYFSSDGLDFYPAPASIYKAEYNNKYFICYYHGSRHGDVIYRFSAKLPKTDRNCQFSNGKTQITCSKVENCELSCS